ncbi:MAG: triose-phosphate isomerase [Alphaproteobacteria bacterium]|nr:triose-phosphate isomerase [Alphaproteobacteria bacterium]
MTKTPLLVANWKMHGNKLRVAQFAQQVSPHIPSQIEAVFCPPYPYLHIPPKGPLKLGAQDCATTQEGAYTGEVSASMLRDIGCEYVILGHSERRQHFEEHESMIATKAVAALQVGLVPIICIGESEREREEGLTVKVLERQLSTLLPLADGLVIAYEPIWAIGTGKTPTLNQIEEAHGFIHAQLAKTARDSAPHVLYGGSVKPTNIREILALKAVDGALIGGASLEADAFVTMLRATAEAKGL